MAARSATQAGTEVTKKARTLVGQRLNSLVASAKRLTSKEMTNSTFKRSSGQQWQEDAWEMYDQVGELRYLATTLGGRVAAGRLYVGTIDENDATAPPVPTEDEQLNDVLEAIGDGPNGLQQLMLRLAINLYVAGDGWLVGIPRELMPNYEDDQEIDDDEVDEVDESDLTDLDSLHWRMLSVTEVEFLRDKEVRLHLGESDSEKIVTDPDSVYMIRVWRPHPRRAWESDSPVRSALSVLRELVGMTMHIGAQIDSRLAGAGVFVVPASAIQAMKRARGIPEDSEEDPFTDALIEAMLKPIEDRANAAALVPLVVVVPDDATGLFQHITFSKPLDAEAKILREEAIRRFALGADAPPELLLGTSGMNHWGSWLVAEEVVMTHTVPPLALIADAITVQYLRPIMLELGYSQDVVDNTVVWYDVSHLIVRPNRGSDAQALYELGAIGDDALREANGFDEGDAPGADKQALEKTGPDDAALQALEIVKSMPDLMKDPGLDAVVAQVRNAMYGTPIPNDAEEKRVEAAERAAGNDPLGKAEEDAEVEDAEQRAPEGGGRPSAITRPEPPKFSAEQIIEAFGTDPDLQAYIVGYLQQNGAAREDVEAIERQYAAAETLTFDLEEGPGRLKSGEPPVCFHEGCGVRASGWILHSEGMAYTPYCAGHEEEAIEAATHSTPDGEADPSNIDRTGSYRGGWGTPRPTEYPEPVYMEPSSLSPLHRPNGYAVTPKGGER